jgi:hypothetical protein
MKHNELQELVTGILGAARVFLTTMVRDLGPTKGSLVALICLWSILVFAAFMGRLARLKSGDAPGLARARPPGRRISFVKIKRLKG